MNNPRPLRLLRAAISIVALALAAGCGGGSDSSAVSTTVGPEGATLLGPDGVVVVVPAGALAEPVTIGIARRSEGGPASLPADSRLASAMYEFTPHGLVFQKPVTIRMPAPAGATGPVLMAESGGEWEHQGAMAADGVVSWERNSFSWGLIAACAPSNLPPWSSSNPDPYPCTYPRGSTTLSAAAQGAVTQLTPGDMFGRAGSWRVTQAGVVRFTMSYQAAPDCENPRAKLLRWNPASSAPAQVLFDGPVSLATATIAPPPGAFSGSSAPTLRGVGSHSVDVTFSHADNAINPAGLHAFAYSFSCNRPLRPTTRGGDVLTVVAAVPAISPPVPTYTVGGTASGLTAAGLVLQNNGADDLSVAASGAFTFATALAAGSPYDVTVKTQPAGQACSVTSGTGSVQADVGNVLVECVAATAVGWGAPVALSVASSNAAAPTLAAASDGGAIVAWTQYDAAPESQYNVYASRFVGGAWQPAQSIENLQANLASSLSGGAYAPTAAAGAGQSVVVYGFSEQQTVYHTAISRLSGGSWVSQVLDTGGNSNSQTVAMTGDGTAAIALYSQYNGSAYALQSQTVDLATGTLLAQEVAPGRGSEPAVVPMPGGDVLAVWNTTGAYLSASRYIGTSRTWTPRVELYATPNTGFAYPASLGANAGGAAIATWLNLDGSYQVWAARYASGAWGTPVMLSPAGDSGVVNNSDTDLTSTAVGVDTAGNGYVAWAQDVTVASSTAHVFVRRCPAAQALGSCEAAVALDTADEYAGIPSMAVAPNGDVWVAWIAMTFPSDELVLRVARRPAGASWEPAVTVGTGLASTDVPPALAVDGQNRVSVAWLGADQRIYVARSQ